MQAHQLELPTKNQDFDLSHIQFNSPGFIHRLMGAAKVYVQFFRGLPLRVRVRDQRGEHVCELPPRFRQALKRALALAGSNVSVQSESMWSFYGYRHGSLEDAAQVVVSELDMAIDEEALDEWVDNAACEREISLVHSVYSVALLGGFAQDTYLA